MNGNREICTDNRGMMSFLVTMVMMLVITLIVIGFTQVTRRNEREALDRQLSTQAFYAAESGINVTQDAINAYVASSGTGGLATKNDCAKNYDAVVGDGTAIADLSSGVKYTCVLVNPIPNSLEFGANQQDSVVMPINANANLKDLTFTWTEQSGGTQTGCSNGGNNTTFLPATTWTTDCDFGVLRLDLVANPSTNGTNSTDLANNTISVFLTPRGTHNGSAPVAFGTGNTAYVISAVDDSSGSSNCSSGTCRAKITLPGDSAHYELRATMLYKNTDKVTVTGTTTPANTAASFNGAQAVVDVTGKAQDEVRRVQARVSLVSTGSKIPANATASNTGICKRFKILPTGSIDGNFAAICS